MNDALISKIAEHRASVSELTKQIEDLTKERVKLEIALGAYEDALQLVQAKSAKRSARTDGESSGRSPRKMKPEWAQILGYFGKLHPRPFSTDEILDIARQTGFEPSRGSVRSQMALYADKQFVERVENGRFRLTSLGFTEAGVKIADAAEPPPSSLFSDDEPTASKIETADDFI